MPVSACGLRLSDEAIRIAVGLRLGLNLCEPIAARVKLTLMRVDCTVFPANAAPAGSQENQQLNEIIWRALKRADIPATKEPAGAVRRDGKRPDGLTLVPWQGGCCLTWDATIIDTLTVSYVQIGSTASAGAANAAATRKHAKYDTSSATHIFVPVGVEIHGPFCHKGLKFVSEIGLRLSTIFDESRESNFLFQRISVFQRFNEVAFRGTFRDIPDTEG